MKISMRSDYGARAIVYLAVHFGEGPVQSAEIAARQSIPEAYLEQLLTTLRKAGLVRSTRGPHGGHELARPPSEITLGDVVAALEGSLVPVDCLDEAGRCQVSAACSLQEVWRRVHETTWDMLRSVTVEELARKQLAHEARTMYYI
ncbi:MAG TPA: RrF2 family transcriptional regulator [Chloroflexota bacterium]|jgi:Rrf2 family protein